MRGIVVVSPSGNELRVHRRRYIGKVTECDTPADAQSVTNQPVLHACIPIVQVGGSVRHLVHDFATEGQGRCSVHACCTGLVLCRHRQTLARAICNDIVTDFDIKEIGL